MPAATAPDGETWITPDAGLYLIYIDPQVELGEECTVAGTITITSP